MALVAVRYWGVRGSIPVPGPKTVRYGGNTACVELETSKARIILDAGTGLRLLGNTIKTSQELYLVLTHLHWDHIQGFPFFGPLFNEGSVIHIFSGHKADVSLESVLKGQMQEPNFPVKLDKLPASMTFNEILNGNPFNIQDVTVRTLKLNHPNEATGFRFESEGKSFVQLTDHEHNSGWDKKVVDFCRGCDILSMDAMFTPQEALQFTGWGHSSWRHACEIASKAGVKRLVLFHHDPNRDDDALDEIGRQALAEFPNAIMAHEGLELKL